MERIAGPVIAVGKGVHAVGAGRLYLITRLATVRYARHAGEGRHGQ